MIYIIYIIAGLLVSFAGLVVMVVQGEVDKDDEVIPVLFFMGLAAAFWPIIFVALVFYGIFLLGLRAGYRVRRHV